MYAPSFCAHVAAAMVPVASDMRGHHCSCIHDTYARTCRLACHTAIGLLHIELPYMCIESYTVILYNNSQFAGHRQYLDRALKAAPQPRDMSILSVIIFKLSKKAYCMSTEFSSSSIACKPRL